MMSLGSVAGALAIARRRDVSTELLAWAAIWLGVAIGLLAITLNVMAAAVASVPVGIATIVLISGANTVIQLQAAPEMRGRALALTTVVLIGSTPIGGPIVGWVSERAGPTAGIWLGALASTIAGCWALVELRRLRVRRMHIDTTVPPPEAPSVVRS